MKRIIKFLLLLTLVIPAAFGALPQTPHELNTFVENILREHGTKPAKELALLVVGKDLPEGTDTHSYEMALSAMGKLDFVENVGSFRMGNRLIKSGFIVKFTTGALFIEIIGFSDRDGWRVIRYSYEIESGGLPKIPECYWLRT